MNTCVPPEVDCRTEFSGALGTLVQLHLRRREQRPPWKIICLCSSLCERSNSVRDFEGLDLAGRGDDIPRGLCTVLAGEMAGFPGRVHLRLVAGCSPAEARGRSSQSSSQGKEGQRGERWTGEGKQKEIVNNNADRSGVQGAFSSTVLPDRTSE